MKSCVYGTEWEELPVRPSITDRPSTCWAVRWASNFSRTCQIFLSVTRMASVMDENQV